MTKPITRRQLNRIARKAAEAAEALGVPLRRRRGHAHHLPPGHDFKPPSVLKIDMDAGIGRIRCWEYADGILRLTDGFHELTFVAAETPEAVGLFAHALYDGQFDTACTFPNQNTNYAWTRAAWGAHVPPNGKQWPYPGDASRAAEAADE